MNPSYELFERGANKRRLSNRIAAGVVFVASIAGAVWGLKTPDPSMARMTALSLIGLVVSLIVFLLTFRKRRGLEALQTPEQIVWYYSIGRGGAISDVMIGTEAGKLHRMPLSDIKHAAPAFAWLRQVAPKATEGFTDERRVRFRKDPASLRVAR